MRKNNLIIEGIPEDMDEIKAVIDLAEFLGVEITENNIDCAHRLPTRTPGKEKPIVAKFVQRWCKDKILEKYVAKMIAKEHIDRAQLNYITNSNQIIYISEHLTPTMQHVFFEARKMKKEGRIEKAYSRNGLVVIVPKNSTEKIQIHSMKQLMESSDI